MEKTAVVFSPIYYSHDPGKGHPESARRVHEIVRELRNVAEPDRKWRFVRPDKAQIQDVELVHGIEYIRMVEAVCRAGGGLLDLQDTVVSSESFEVAMYAVGGTLKAVNLVMERKFENAFALVRPPGHHAAKFRSLGFCLLNNIAVAAAYLQRRFGLQKIAVLDVDAHHGNGTQELFYETDRVLYVSLHEDPREFPGTGFAGEIGKAKGSGYNVNVPLPFGSGDQVYLEALREIVEPIVKQYKPQFILLSAGFDLHYADPIGRLALSGLGVSRVYGSIVDLASEVCQGKLAAALEGGYNVGVVGRLATAAVARMSSVEYMSEDKDPGISTRPKLHGMKAIREARRAQRTFWDV